MELLKQLHDFKLTFTGAPAIALAVFIATVVITMGLGFLSWLFNYR